MVSSRGDRPDSKPTAEIDGEAQIDAEQIFRLIDRVLSFEACIYHQVLPLALEESRLKLGMVNPEDTAAVDYVGRILSYMNCSLVFQPIGADIHREMLSAYLKYKGTSKPATERVRSLAAGHPAAQAAAKRLGKENVTASPSDQPTLILEMGEQGKQGSHSRAEVPEVTCGAGVPPLSQSDRSVERSGVKLGENVQKDYLSFHSPPAPSAPPAPPALFLEVQAAHLSNPVEVLATLPPKNLLQELLGRVLSAGIGRLYFERKTAKFGRILWSQNGSLQSVLEELPLPVFQGVIDELKRVTHLPLNPVQEPKQAEIERLYQQNRLLLRLRVMPGVHGEEATLQVLRGAALKFYQQQQMAHLSRDALGVAQQLQRKLNDLQKRAYLNPSLSAGQLEALSALNQLVKNVDHQMEALKHLQAQQGDTEIGE